MARRKTKERLKLEDGVRRMATWCQANFPPKVEVAVNVVDAIDEETLGLAVHTEDGGRVRIEIVVSADQSMREALDTTMHEWAHAHTMPWLADWQNDHEDYFWIVFGRMYRRWHDQGGQVAASRL
jgi:hypothetical protein